MESSAQSVVQNGIYFPGELFKMKAVEVRPGDCVTDSFWNRLEWPHPNKQRPCSNPFRTQLLALLAVPDSSERYPSSRDAGAKKLTQWSDYYLHPWRGGDLGPTCVHLQSWAQRASKAAVSSNILLPHLSVIHSLSQVCSSSKDLKRVLWQHYVSSKKLNGYLLHFPF